MSQRASLRGRAEALAAPMPPLLADAAHLAATVLMGQHGRRRAGMGDEFWQYRPAVSTDSARAIDWRRSAQSDAHFVREKEWQAVQTVLVWVDRAASMGFSSTAQLPTKADRARLLGLAISVLLIRGGERVGLTAARTPARIGEMQLVRMAQILSQDEPEDYGAPDTSGIQPRSRAIFISDFMGDLAATEAAMTKAADRGVTGVLLQILDPQEEAFPFAGRTVFESMGGALRHETLKARDLRARYLERLAARKARLRELARLTGWRYHCHHSDASALSALLWLYRAMERVI